MDETVISYADIATAVWDATHTRGRAGKLTLDELDAILAQHGLTPTGPGRRGRTDWNQQRHRHRKQFNRFLQKQHGHSLEVVGHVNVKSRSGSQPIYGLVKQSDKLVGRPFHIGEKFYRQINRHLNAIARLHSSAFPPPPDLDPDKLERWNLLNERNIKRMVGMYFDLLEQNTMKEGMAEHIPPLSADIIDLREARSRRARVPAKRKKARA